MSRVVILEIVRRHCTTVLTAGYVVFLMILGLASSRLESTIWSPFIFLLALGTGAGLIGPEFSSGTLQLILVKPINRSVYLVSRVAGVVLFVALAASLAFSAEAIGRLAWGGGQKIDIAAIALLNNVSEAALVCAVLALFGSFLRAYFNVALYWLIQVVLSVIKSMLGVARMAKDGFLGWLNQFVTRHPIVTEALDGFEHNVFPDAPLTLDWRWLLMVWSNVLVAIVLACLIFRNREVPYGAD
jgi:ABC-type transport system involved in multi-copper enzyme maturation permease subunit